MVFSQQITHTNLLSLLTLFIEAANNMSLTVSSVCFMFKPAKRFWIWTIKQLLLWKFQIQFWFVCWKILSTVNNSVWAWYDEISMIRWYDDISMIRWYLDDTMTFRWYDDISMIRWYLDDAMTFRWYDDISMIRWHLDDTMTSRWYGDTMKS